MLHTKLFVSALLSVLLTACASFSEVKKEDRDLANNFDGEWVADNLTTDKQQRYAQWRFTCKQFTTPISLKIEGSGVRVRLDNGYLEPLNEAYISSNGMFKTVFPTGFKGKTSLHSDTDLRDIETRYIVEGNLTPEGEGKGSFRFGWAHTQYNGCKTKLVFAKE